MKAMTLTEKIRELREFLRQDLESIDELLKDVESEDIRQMRIYAYEIMNILDRQTIKIDIQIKKMTA